MCLVLRGGNLRGRGAQLLWKHAQNLFSCSDAALCPASLYPAGCLGHPVWVPTPIAGTGIRWDGVMRDDVTVVTLSFCVDCLLSLHSGA